MAVGRSCTDSTSVGVTADFDDPMVLPEAQPTGQILYFISEIAQRL